MEALHSAYKAEIGEAAPTPEEFDRLFSAMAEGVISFFGAVEDGNVVACCSVTKGFSTFDYRPSGVFEDFYILPAYRKRGIARRLAQFAYQESGIGTLTVGCADCDLGMYQAIGFSIPLGNLRAYANEEKEPG